MHNTIRNGIIATALAGSLLAGPVAAEETVVDILGLYSANIDINGYDPEARLVAMVEYANQALTNSKADFRYRLVHAEKIDIANDDKTNGAALKAVKNNQAVQNLRIQYGADMVALITKLGPYCGLAYVGRGRDDVFYSSAKNNAYSVTGYVCTRSLAHELGHNLGLAHSARQGNQGSLHTWGRGHGVDGTFVTTMAYTLAYGTTRVPYFSNPDINQCRGLPCGVHRDALNGADAVRSLKVAAPQAAAFLPTVVGPKPGPSLLVNGDFETLDGWSVFRNNGQISLSNDKVSGNHAALITNRTGRHAGPVTQLQQSLESNATYAFSAWVKLGDGIRDRQRAVASLYAIDEQGVGRWHRLGRVRAVKGQWIELMGVFAANGQTFTDVKLRVSGPRPGNDLLVDDMRFVKKRGNL